MCAIFKTHYGKNFKLSRHIKNWPDTASKWQDMNMEGGSWASLWLPLPQKIASISWTLTWPSGRTECPVKTSLNELVTIISTGFFNNKNHVFL
jgi:hypothetical protein